MTFLENDFEDKRFKGFSPGLEFFAHRQQCAKRCYPPQFNIFFVPFPAVGVTKCAMAKHRIGIIGGSGLYSIEGFTNQKWVKVKTPFGAAVGRFSHRQARRTRRGFPAAPRARPPHPAQRTESSRQHLGDEKTRRRNGSSASAPSARSRKNTSRATSFCLDQFLDRTKQIS